MSNSEENLVKDCVPILNNDFQLDPSESLTPSNTLTLEELKQLLAKMISYLLDKDFNRLLNAMYRIDIAESKFKVILESYPPQEIATHLAEEIIARTLQKIEIRKKYQS